MKALIALSATVMLLGCGDDDCCTSTHDAAPAVDARSADADAACRQWRLVPVPLTEVISLEALAIHPERSARLLVDVLQCPGDVPAMPEYGFTLENEFVALRMGVWRTQPDCSAPTRVQRPITIRFLYPGSWKFVLPDGTRTVSVVAAPGGVCNTSNPNQCDSDCDCTGPAVCLSAMGFATAFSRCAVPCELDRDCGGDGTCESAADELSFVCTSGTAECAAPTDCPFGFDCQSGRCEPIFTLSSSTRHDCACDDDCDPGLRCAFHDGYATGRCESLCLTQSSAWCEGPHVCSGGIEPVTGVCGWIGD